MHILWGNQSYTEHAYHIHRFDIKGEPHKAPYFAYKNSIKSLKKDISHLSLEQYIEALKPPIELDQTNTSIPILSSLPLSLDQFRHNPNKLSVVSQIYHELLCNTKSFDVKPVCCHKNLGEDMCSFSRHSLFKWNNLFFTMCGIFEFHCYNQYCVVHHCFVQRNVLLQLCLQECGFAGYKSGNMITSLGVKSFLQNIFVLQTNISVVVNVMNIYK